MTGSVSGAAAKEPSGAVAAARRIATAAAYGFVTTTPGGLQTRLVQLLEITDDCRITFSTGPTTRKAASIRADPSVCYSAFDQETLASAAVYGTARLDEDLDRRQDLWDESLAPFFPDGPASDGFRAGHHRCGARRGLVAARRVDTCPVRVELRCG